MAEETSEIKKYKHIFFDLDHTIWDFDKNAEETLHELYQIYRLHEIGVPAAALFIETYTRNTLDVSAIPIIKKLSHLPMTSDPSHGTGLRDKVPPMARASLTAFRNGSMLR